jgi:hypothetical protein
LLTAQTEDDHPHALGVEVLKRRSARRAPIVDDLREHERAGRLSPGLAGLALSFMHMPTIRICPAAARKHEIVLYEILSRFYREQVRAIGIGFLREAAEPMMRPAGAGTGRTSG